ncbi:MAG TPA: 50S ribosomal protein L21, partial [Pirellulales bacterium]|nr:50S ribosomal protein L21 [Pirellulales bacterium]
QDGSRQLKVQEGEEIDIDYRKAGAGTQVTLDRVLAVGGGDGLKFGVPLLEGAQVTAEVLGVGQGPKLVVQKFRRRKNSRRKTGHRQMVTRVRIGKISVG